MQSRKKVFFAAIAICILFTIKGFGAVTNGEDLGPKQLDPAELRDLYKLSRPELTAKLDALPPLEAWRRALVLGAINMDQKKIASAEEYFNLALKYVAGSTYAQERVSTLFPLAFAQFMKGDQQKGLEYLLQAKSIVDSNMVRDEKIKITLLIELGEAYYRLGMYKDSLEVYQEADKTAQTLNNELLSAKCKMGLGYAYIKLGINLDKAQDLMVAACEVYKKNKMTADASEALKCLGNIESGSDLDKAQEFYVKALVLYKECEDDHGQGNCHFNLGLLCKDKGRYDKALEHLNSALYFFSRSGSPTGNGISQLAMGQTYILMKKFPEAKAALDQASSLLERSQSWDRLGETEESLGDLAAAQDDREKANSYYKKAVERFNGLKLSDRADATEKKIR